MRRATRLATLLKKTAYCLVVQDGIFSRQGKVVQINSEKSVGGEEERENHLLDPFYIVSP